MPRIAVIADRGLVPRFARDALDRVAGIDSVTVFSCTNTRFPRRPLRHAVYYALNLATVRNCWSRLVPVAGGTKAIAGVTDFASRYDGAWQTLPDHVIDALGQFDIILKFGMGLLRVPDRLAVPILSYHHGDPDKFRGRPAGFWEIASGEPVMGQMVQVIGNRLDAGNVVAYAETKVFPWSWRATLIESFRHSPLILGPAIANALAGRSLAKPCAGRNWRLPSNARALAVLAAMTGRRLRRWLYGAAVEKAWAVSLARAPAGGVAGLLAAFPPPAQWQTLEPQPGYAFYADPFFTRHPPGLLVEALHGRSGVGEIVRVDEAGHRAVSNGAGHMSYPSTCAIGGREIVVPEMAGWSPPRAFALGHGLDEVARLDVEGDPRLLDPTLIERDGRIWLFANDRAEGSGVLHLWSAERLDARFERHPLSPIRISPVGARMGGALVEQDGALIRLGQDFSRGYGDGLVAFAIERLDREDYAERMLGPIRLADRHGPHTLNFRGGEMVFDWYRERLSPLAGVRRLLPRLRKGRGG